MSSTAATTTLVDLDEAFSRFGRHNSYPGRALTASTPASLEFSGPQRRW
jgi:hypothetical protein